jgi:hypothetical protein
LDAWRSGSARRLRNRLVHRMACGLRSSRPHTGRSGALNRTSDREGRSRQRVPLTGILEAGPGAKRRGFGGERNDRMRPSSTPSGSGWKAGWEKPSLRWSPRFRRSMASSPWTTFRARRDAQPRANFRVVLADIEASAHQAFRVVPHFHTGKLERPRHLVAREQTQFDTFAALREILKHRMRGVSEQRYAAFGPILYRRAVAQHPHFPGVDLLQQGAHRLAFFMEPGVQPGRPDRGERSRLRGRARVGTSARKIAVERVEALPC